MENPATWGRAERIIHEIYLEHARHHAAVTAGLEEPLFGFSLPRQITNALRAEGLLVNEQPEDVRERLLHLARYWESMAGPANSVYEMCARDVRAVCNGL